MENVELENMIDQANLDKVLGDLVDICYGKQAHLQENWQDESAAKLWEKCGIMLNQLRARLPNYPGINS